MTSQIKDDFFFFFYLPNCIYRVIFFSSLFPRANQQSALNVTVNGQGNVTEKLDLNWYLGIYSGKVESSGLLSESLSRLQ